MKKDTNKKGIYLIAEIGLNHNGSIKLAQKMIIKAKESGADAVKFQYIIPDNLVKKESPVYDIFKKCTFSRNQWIKLRELAVELKIDFIVTPFCTDSLKETVKLNPDKIKIASGDFNNFILINEVVKTKYPIIISSGASTLKEADKTVKYLKDKKSDFILLHCVSLYPCPVEKANLIKIEFLRKRYKIPVGFSDHTKGIEAAVASAILGAEVIEKHFTLDRSLPGPDQKISATPSDLKKIKNITSKLFENVINFTKDFLAEETEVRYNARKSLIVSKDLKKNHKLKINDLKILRPENGLSPELKIIGSKLKKDIKKGELISKEDIYL